MLTAIFALVAFAGPPAAEPPPPRPRLVLAGGPLFGPHAAGESTCQVRGGAQRCEHTGNFFGVGANLELRVRLVGPLYIQGRGAVVGNVRPRPYGVHRGLVDLGLGLGVYSRLGFIRIEYMFVPTLGPDTYRPPFYDQQAGRDVWTRSAGMLSGGVRKYFTPRLAGELWAGIMVGPRSRRTTLQEDAGIDRILVTFLASVGISFDLIPGRPAPIKLAPVAPTAPVAAPPPPVPAPPTEPPPQPVPPSQPPPPADDPLGPWQPAPQD